jgi:hypothetical protein
MGGTGDQTVPGIVASPALTQNKKAHVPKASLEASNPNVSTVLAFFLNRKDDIFSGP